MPHENGGFEERYLVFRQDGEKIDPDAHFFVLNYNGTDPHAIAAIHAYAMSVVNDNPQLAEDLRKAVERPAVWPKQHL